MAFGLALSGGGVRGAAHIGVLCALEESGMLPDSIAGTSAGGIVAGLYASGMSPGRMRELVVSLSGKGTRIVDADYRGLLKTFFQFTIRKPISFSGLLKGNKLEDYLSVLTEKKNITDAGIKTIIPAVDLYSGKTIAYSSSLKGIKPVRKVVWKTNIALSAAIRASISLPAVFQPKMMDGMCLVDGGVTDVLPVDLLIASGEANVLAVDLSKNYHVPECNNIIEISSHSLSLMSMSLRECRATGEKLLLKPSLPDKAGLLTFNEMKTCMDKGYEAAKDSMPAIKKLFA